MKRILIINKSFETGGIQSAMVNMANELQRFYHVDLLILNPSGPMKDRLAKTVPIIPASWMLYSLGLPFREALKSGQLKIVLFRMFATIWSKVIDNRLPIELAMRQQEKMDRYDLVIAYHHEQRKHSVLSGFSRIADRCISADQKISWIHFDSHMVDMDRDFNKPYYEKMDRIVCLTQSLRDGFADGDPALASKTEVCYNFLDYDQIKKKSMEEQTYAYPAEGIICFSACRLNVAKALVRGVHCMAPVFREHTNLMWYIAGDGPERKAILAAIQEEKLEEQIILLGNQSNPYPYMKNADLLINVSYHEAAPMVFMEAKALGIPIFATKTSSAEELLQDPPCAVLCENSEQGIYAAFRDLMEHPDRLTQAKAALQDYIGSNEESLQKFRKWLQET